MKSLRVNKCNMLIMLCRKDIVCNYWIPNPLSSGMNKSYFICYNFFIDSRNHKYLKQLKSFQVTNRNLFWVFIFCIWMQIWMHIIFVLNKVLFLMSFQLQQNIQAPNALSWLTFTSTKKHFKDIDLIKYIKDTMSYLTKNGKCLLRQGEVLL